MTTITVRAPAKINLVLRVGAPTPDGYHPLETVYQALSLYDDVTVADADHWSLAVTSDERIDVTGVPLDERNLAWRAAVALADHHGLGRHAAIGVHKGIPVAGGLAGGSADAAATLVALDRLWDLQTPDDVLLAIAASLGSDVPFALLGGTVLGTGHGEVVRPVTDAGQWWWVVVQSPEGLSTPKVYHHYDALVPDPAPLGDGLGSLRLALEHADVDLLAGSLHNDLQEPALDLRPDLRRTLRDGREAGALAVLVSGSGPTCLFLCRDATEATAVRGGLVERGHESVGVAFGPVAGAHVVEYG